MKKLFILFCLIMLSCKNTKESSDAVNITFDRNIIYFFDKLKGENVEKLAFSGYIISIHNTSSKKIKILPNGFYVIPDSTEFPVEVDLFKESKVIRFDTIVTLNPGGSQKVVLEFPLYPNDMKKAKELLNYFSDKKFVIYIGESTKNVVFNFSSNYNKNKIIYFVDGKYLSEDKVKKYKNFIFLNESSEF